MYDIKSIVTEDEQILISRYPTDIQEKLKDKLLEAKEKSFRYERIIDQLEQGLAITFNDNTTIIGKLNTARQVRLLLEMKDGINRKPSLKELEHDGRLEEFKQYPKGTRIKANGEVVKG
jgi:S-adenosylmethionine:tRNA-ribosyltransferase-isomerase (queuine synthetase)